MIKKNLNDSFLAKTNDWLNDWVAQPVHWGKRFLEWCCSLRKMGILLALLVVLLATLYAPPASSQAATVGVHPDQLALYSGSEFSCKDGSAKISISQVNDNFCDCADGSDEPATSACGNSGGQFWCVNRFVRFSVSFRHTISCVLTSDLRHKSFPPQRTHAQRTRTRMHTHTHTHTHTH